MKIAEERKTSAQRVNRQVGSWPSTRINADASYEGMAERRESKSGGPPPHSKTQAKHQPTTKATFMEWSSDAAFDICARLVVAVVVAGLRGAAVCRSEERRVG